MISDGSRVRVVTYGELRAGEIPPGSGADAIKMRSLAAHPLAGADEPAAVLLMRGGSVLAHFWLVPGRIRIGGASHRLSYGSDYDVVDPGAGAALVGSLFLSALKVAGSLGVFAVSQASLRVYRAARLEPIRVPRMTLPMRAGGVVERYAGGRRAAAVLSAPVDLLLRVALTVRSSRVHIPAGVELRRVAQLGEEVGRIDDASRGDFWLERGHEELNWAMAHPWIAGDHRFDAYHLVHDGHVVAYAVVRVRRFGVARVASLMRSGVLTGIADRHAILLRLLIEILSPSGIHVFDMCTTDPALIAAGRRLGMLQRDVMLHALRLGGGAAIDAQRAGLRVTDLHLEMGEGDAIMG